jgi:alpha-ketoglutaric semialdehyde dehydrogenase
MKTFNNFIAGRWSEPETGEYFENRNPADHSDLIGRFPLSGPADVDRAVASAWRGFEAWRRTPPPVRGEILRRVGDICSLRARRRSRTQ